jgi:voltage-gated potassium channel
VEILINTVRAIRTLWVDPQFKSLTRLALVAITSGTAFYWSVEGLSPVDALYFSVTTLTTVGYGDFSPETAAGKLFTVVYVLLGVGILLAFLTRVAAQVVASHAENGGPLRHVRARSRKEH